VLPCGSWQEGVYDFGWKKYNKEFPAQDKTIKDGELTARLAEISDNGCDIFMKKNTIKVIPNVCYRASSFSGQFAIESFKNVDGLGFEYNELAPEGSWIETAYNPKIEDGILTARVHRELSTGSGSETISFCNATVKIEPGVRYKNAGDCKFGIERLDMTNVRQVFPGGTWIENARDARIEGGVLHAQVKVISGGGTSLSWRNAEVQLHGEVRKLSFKIEDGRFQQA